MLWEHFEALLKGTQNTLFCGEIKKKNYLNSFLTWSCGFIICRDSESQDQSANADSLVLAFILCVTELYFRSVSR